MKTAKSNERHIICELRCEPKDRDRVRDLILQFVLPARAEPGCLYYDLYQQIDAPDTFFIQDGWVDEAAVNCHAAHPHVAEVMKELGPLLTYGPSITFMTRTSDYAFIVVRRGTRQTRRLSAPPSGDHNRHAHAFCPGWTPGTPSHGLRPPRRARAGTS